MKDPMQRILFGSPGTGKSHKIKNVYIPDVLGIENPENIVSTVFHPEYTYGDFMGKLLPHSTGRDVVYNFEEGDFLRALGQAYKNILTSGDDEEPGNVVLVIDEINRGNSSEIFGKVFQLLDRNVEAEDDEERPGWSSYEVDIPKLQHRRLMELTGVDTSYDNPNKTEPDTWNAPWLNTRDIKNRETVVDNMYDGGVLVNGSKIRIPPNMSILATMNTSNESVYLMDSAFKRRWSWEFVDIGNTHVPKPDYNTSEEDSLSDGEWKELVTSINNYMKQYHESIRGIEDKQVGHYFIVERPVPAEKVRTKLMFFMWDSVFNRDKRPLADLMEISTNELITFGDFSAMHNKFVNTLLDS